MSNVEHWLLYLVTLGCVITCLMALVDAVRRPAAAFVAHGKLTKPIWLGILLVATLVSFGGLVSFFGAIGLVAAIVYLVDVKPALDGTNSW